MDQRMDYAEDCRSGKSQTTTDNIFGKPSFDTETPSKAQCYMLRRYILLP